MPSHNKRFAKSGVIEGVNPFLYPDTKICSKNETSRLK